MINYGLENKTVLTTTNKPQDIGATTAYAFAKERMMIVHAIKVTGGHAI